MPSASHLCILPLVPLWPRYTPAALCGGRDGERALTPSGPGLNPGSAFAGCEALVEQLWSQVGFSFVNGTEDTACCTPVRRVKQKDASGCSASLDVPQAPPTLGSTKPRKLICACVPSPMPARVLQCRAGAHTLRSLGVTELASEALTASLPCSFPIPIGAIATLHLS